MTQITGKQTLAALGGDPVAPAGSFRPWPPIDEEDRRLVNAALDSGAHTVGENYKALQEEFAEWIGVPNAVFCNSGTAALHMALVACQCGCGDEVIVPAYTWPSSATCCLHNNAIPVFVDIDWDTMNMDPAKIEAAITPRTKAIVVVHLHGLAARMDAVLDIARRHKLRVIEDCCQAHGTTYDGARVGVFGDCATFSCNQNKMHCSGEGGFFIAKDDELFERGKTLWYFGEHRRPDANPTYNAYGMGWMYRSTELVAAFALAQLHKLDGYIDIVAANAARLTERLAGVGSLILPVAPEPCGHNWYNYTIRFDMDALGHADDPARFRDKLVKAICAEGVETGVWQGWPVPEMTAIAAKNAYGRGCPWSCTDSKVDYALAQFPVAQKHCDRHTGMTFPLRPPNGTAQADLVADAWIKVIENADQVDRIEM